MGQSKSKYIKLGIFIITGLALFIFAIFYIGGKENLFTKTIEIYSIFDNVSGLSQGSSVLYAGINIGTVQSIDIISPNKVKVKISIESNVKKFIKKNSETSINSDGLVGNKVLVISSGTDDMAQVENGDSLHSVKPVTFNDIMINLNETTKEANLIVKDLADVVSKVNNGEGTLGKLVNNSDLFDNLDKMMQSFAASGDNVNKILTGASNVIDLVTQDIQNLKVSIQLITTNVADITTKMNSSQSLVGTLLTDTVFANNIKSMIVNTDRTTANLELGSFSFYQNMEALKHNFLFKGYFEDIGYWNDTDYDKSMNKAETKALNKEANLLQRKLMLERYSMKLDSMKNVLERQLDSLKAK